MLRNLGPQLWSKEGRNIGTLGAFRIMVKKVQVQVYYWTLFTENKTKKDGIQWLQKSINRN